MGVTDRERQEIEAANLSGRQPVVFVHGLWLLASSWDRWRRFFEKLGFATLAPGWPDDPETVEEARRQPEVLAHKGIKQVTAHFATVIDQLKQPPVLIGHSFGGLIAQQLAGRGLAAVCVAIDPAPFRGVLPLPLSALKAASPVLANPASYGRAVPLTFEQFRFAFANAVSETEARALHESFAVPAPGRPLFQAATANLNPWTEAQVDTLSPKRGPLLIISGQKDNTVPWALANAAYKRQRRNASITALRELPNRGHSLTIDSGWQDVAEATFAFVKQPAAKLVMAAAPELASPLEQPAPA